MIAVAEYLFKVILCSAVFTGYYWLALRNKIFHSWNRFYLLGAVVCTLIIPFTNLTLLPTQEQEKAVAYQLIENITTDERWFEEANPIATPQTNFITTERILLSSYILISAVFLVLLFLAMIRIIKLLRQNPHWQLNGLVFVDTEARGTPFSFFKYIFWNRKIDFDSAEG
jgi:NADH:ubiquinone oxidoreductase subunit 6 (subunit J)